MQKDKERDKSKLKTDGGGMVCKASSARISSQKGKQAPNKKTKKAITTQTKKNSSKTKIQDAKNKCLKCKEKAPVSALNK